MKALILCGGTGSRLRPITHTRAKQLLPVANKPIVCYGIESIVRAGINEIGIITGETGKEIREKLGDGTQFNAHFTYIPQDAPLGIAHAVKTARDFLQNKDFIVYLGDNLIKHEVEDLLKQYQAQEMDALIQIKEVDDPTQFGVAELDDNQRVIRLEEKPKEPKSNYAVVGVYIFNAKIHDQIDQLQPSGRGEFEITHAIQGLLDSNANVGSNLLTGWWLDTGKKDDLLEANRIVLDERPDESYIASTVEVSDTSRITGRVRILGGTKIENCIIRGPAIIGANCTLRDAYVGPYTSLGDNVELIASEIEHSIVLDRGRILNLGDRVSDSLIGENTEVTRTETRPGSFRLMLGDDSRVEFI